MASLKLSLLGSPRVERDGVPVEFDTRKNVALIAYLAMTGLRPGDEGHTRDGLITLLWPEREPSRARAILRRNLSVLKRALGEEWLIVERETVGLSCTAATEGCPAGLAEPPEQALWLDVARFRALLDSWQRHDHPRTNTCPECLAALTEAVELYRGDFLEGFSLRDSVNFDEWQFFETEGLRNELAGALKGLVRCHSSQGSYQQAIRYARRWVGLDPLHEPAQRALIELYAQAGQRAAALRQYGKCARVLKAELGLSPSRETTALCERIRAGPAESAEAPAPPPARRHNLPVQAIPLVGRERELAEIGDCLADPGCRLLTLVGPGGSGKTRLAVEAAASLVDDFEHGVFFVSLAGVQPADRIVPTVGQAIGLAFRAQQDPQEQLLAYLARRRMLLILDNFEHLLVASDQGEEGGSRLVTAILEAAPGVKVLVTSRAALRIRAESLFPVTGMAHPDWEAGRGVERIQEEDAAAYSAIRLFVQSARRVEPDFNLMPENLQDVIRICRLVDGLPLGILLASSWVRMLSPGEIAGQLDTGLDLLETDLRDVPIRQRSIRAVFDHSWDLLTERQRTTMEALSIFRGGFTHQAARAVARASLRDLRSLVDRSLVQPAEKARYQIHELLRQYSGEQLARSPSSDEAARDRHAAYYAAALEAWGADLKGPRQREALLEIDLDIDNARAAWDWAVARADGKQLSRAAEGLSLYYVFRGLDREAEVAFRGATERLRAVSGLDADVLVDALEVLVKLLAFQSGLPTTLDRGQVAWDVLEEGLDLLKKCELAGQDTRAQEMWLLYGLGQAELRTGRGDFRKSLERSLALARSVGDQWWAAIVLNGLGAVDAEAGDFREARRKHEESLAVCRALGDERGIARATMMLAWIHVLEGELEMAERLARDSLTAWRGLGDPAAVAAGLDTLGYVLMRGGKYADSQPLFEERLAIFTDLGLSGVGCLTSLGVVKVHLGEYESAREQLESGLHISQEMGELLLAAAYRGLLVLLAVREGAYAEARRLCRESIAGFDSCNSRDNAVWSRCTLAYAELGLGDIKDARHCAVQALEWARERGSYLILGKALPVAVLLLLDQGETERAAEIYALACTFPYVANSQWYEDVVGRQIDDAAANLPPDVVAAARDRGRARDVQATLDELIAEWGEASQRFTESAKDRTGSPLGNGSAERPLPRGR